jgi:AraC family transcriptional regulator, transcriptional activator of pobA
MKNISIEEFYEQIKTEIPSEITKEIGHFNVFNIKELF